MAVKIRLARHGRKKRAFYHIVVADSKSPRDGRFIEKLGTYNPVTQPAQIEIDVDSAINWLDKGAQPTDTARSILKYKGVIYKRHLLRGVKLGVVKEDEVEAKFAEWAEARLNKESDKYAKAEQLAAEKKAKEAAEKKAAEEAEAKAKAEEEAKAAAEAAAAEAATEEENPEASAEEAPAEEATEE